MTLNLGLERFLRFADEDVAEVPSSMGTDEESELVAPVEASAALLAGVVEVVVGGEVEVLSGMIDLCWMRLLAPAVV